ncbi:hypothetical protein HPULCUR_001181 [Helicostylum pulchrum]|uniref:HECT-type E3 ubiquitin transferase n=1 Tax=Helicostylum pulchrum TaxID=562976 RepID=A0ABP9XLZ8_9FUNG
MFTSTDSSRKKFIETTRLEREKRENERKEKEGMAKKVAAAKVIQTWWKRRERNKLCRMQSWNWWEEQRKAEFDTIDFLQFLGFYCFLTGQTPDSNRLKIVVKYLTANKFGQNKIPYFTLLIDMRYMTRARKYLEAIIMQCIQTTTNSNDLTLFGPELTFLLQYLNPKTYQTKHVIDPYHLIDIPDKILSSFGQSILKTTLCQFSLRPAFILCVQEIVKLEDRSTKDVARIKAMKLWLTTMTRLTLFPIEHAEASSDALDIVTAAQFLWKNTLAVPYITCLISKMMVDRLRPWTLNTMPLLLQQTDMISTDLSGNGFLFLLANLVELSKSDKLVELTASFIVYIEPYFSDRQTPIFPHYHPIFKWSKATWGNTLPPIVFDKAMKQMEYIWSRSFMDEIFADIISFEQKSTGKKLFKSSGGDIALFSMHVESIFSLYIQLTNLFKAHRKVIFYRIAFTTQLMPQLWKLMNQFGPKGNMIIYLEAAKQKDINKEPLVQILKVFCEACSIVFLTLDNVDIFTRQKPFSPTDLIQISSFLNNFYFLLIKQQTDIPTEIPPSADSFRSARRLLLQIYDLDLHHPFCPPNHWLLISMSKGMKSFFSSIFSESGNNNTTSSASLFLSNLRQGDPVPLRILQLMPHTVSFDMRLKIFRDWIALDKSIIITKNNGKIVTVRRGQVLEDGFHALSGISPSAWKGTVRVSFVNEFGINEAGIDQGGPFKDFITMLINEAFEPNYGLFSSTKLNSFYPSATSSVHGRNHIQIFEFIGKVIGKALYEGILLDVKFAGFLLARLLGRNVFLEELKELDAEVWKNLTFIKHYEGDVEDLGLSFEADENIFGKIESHELKYRGKNTSVTNSNKVEYVYLMADYKLNQRAKEQTKAFIHGFRTVISESWIKLFSPPELQRVLSGEDTDFGTSSSFFSIFFYNLCLISSNTDISDLRRHTEYQDGYFDLHPVIRLLWQIVGEFSSTEKRAFLKFTTGCPKPPLGGFEYLQPPFTIRMVSTDATEGPKLVKSFFKLNTNRSGRLPSSSTW